MIDLKAAPLLIDGHVGDNHYRCITELSSRLQISRSQLIEKLVLAPPLVPRPSSRLQRYAKSALRMARDAIQLEQTYAATKHIDGSLSLDLHEQVGLLAEKLPKVDFTPINNQPLAHRFDTSPTRRIRVTIRPDINKAMALKQSGANPDNSIFHHLQKRISGLPLQPELQWDAIRDYSSLLRYLWISADALRVHYHDRKAKEAQEQISRCPAFFHIGWHCLPSSDIIGADHA